MNKTRKVWALFVLAMAAMMGSAMAVPISIEPIVTDAVAQVGSVVTDVFPYVAALVGAILIFKLVRRFVH